MIIKNKPYVIITGISGGIGNALVNSYHEAGYIIIGTDKKVPKNLKLVDHFFQIDLESLINDDTKAKFFYKSVKYIIKNNGLHALINNAAIQIIKKVDNITINDMKHSLNINCIAPFFLIKCFSKELTKIKGSVVNISSIHSELTKPNFVAYATSKSALTGLTKSLAVEIGSRIRVNAIAPAAIKTEMLMAGFENSKNKFKKLSNYHPVLRIGKPSEISELSLFLTSEKAGFINGSIFQIDGGISKCLHDPV
jgi:NAD(P)-dependent dehydrogenase (short-subunit alcohol dehydrogenase family)